MTIAEARQIAFTILTHHPECLKDDKPLQDLIEEIAQAIVNHLPMTDITELLQRQIEIESAGSDHGSSPAVEVMKLAKGEIERLRKSLIQTANDSRCFMLHERTKKLLKEWQLPVNG